MVILGRKASSGCEQKAEQEQLEQRCRQRRRRMVEQVRAGVGMREVARAFRASLSVVQRWVGRADGQRLDRVDWNSKATSTIRPINRTAPGVEALILTLREQLAKTSDLGEHGAEAIRAALLELGLEKPPSVRTVGRVLERSGVLDGQ